MQIQNALPITKPIDAYKNINKTLKISFALSTLGK
jgi:hypothetical protein